MSMDISQLKSIQTAVNQSVSNTDSSNYVKIENKPDTFETNEPKKHKTSHKKEAILVFGAAIKGGLSGYFIEKAPSKVIREFAKHSIKKIAKGSGSMQDKVAELSNKKSYQRFINNFEYKGKSISEITEELLGKSKDELKQLFKDKNALVFTGFKKLLTRLGKEKYEKNIRWISAGAFALLGICTSSSILLLAHHLHKTQKSDK